MNTIASNLSTPVRVVYDGTTEIRRTSNYSHGCEPITVDHGLFSSLEEAMVKFKVTEDDLEPNGNNGWLQYQGGQNALLFLTDLSAVGYL
jgi:hypothetical protein